MPVRRHADPVNIIRIWDAIRHAHQSRTSADAARITKYIQNTENLTQGQVELFLKQTCKDKLIICNKSTTHLTYKITTQELPVLDGKDWYCFECHLAGDVTPCSNCFRVFHQDCITSSKKKFEQQKQTNNYPDAPDSNVRTLAENDQQVTIVGDDSDDVIISLPNNGVDQSTSESLSTNKEKEWIDKRNLPFDETLCSVCNINRIDYDCGLDKTEINDMLRFVLNRIRAWLPNTITHTMAVEDRPTWLTDAELTWRANQLFFEHRDMSVIEVNSNTGSYNLFSEFLADVYTVHHNVAIFHGLESQEYGAAELMIRDAVHDIAEMKCCVDCYKHSNEKIHNKWFCLPCRVPHELVWAKQKGYPYWPAKIIKESPTHCDVRFFGGKYERANLLKSYVKPIVVPVESLQIKTTAYFNKACEELKYHQLLLSNPLELEKLLASSKPKRRTLTKQKSTLLNTPNSKTKGKQRKSKSNMPDPSLDSSNVSIPQVSSNSKSATKRKGRKSSDDTKEKKKKGVEDEHNSSETISGNVIDISDGEEEEYQQEYSFRENTSQDAFSLDETYEQVSSSTEHFGKPISPRRESGMMPLDQPYSDSVEKMRRKLEGLSKKKDIIKCAMDCMQMEVDKITNDHNDHLKRLFESHNQQISETKKKQWCYNCEQDAIYHCCWNTAYCSQTCQQQHWQAEHKKVCRRKRS